MKLQNWREYLIEAWGLGTFMVSAGFFATVIYSPSCPFSLMIPDNNFLKGLLMGITMGVTAIAIIYSPWGKRSGAHINPAVTLTFFRLGKIDALDTLGYVFAQFIGGVIGVLLVAVYLGQAFTDPPVNYVVTVPGTWGTITALIIEFLMSFGLMLMVLLTSNNNALSSYTGIFSGIMVATFITLFAPVSGMSINPARSFASAFPAKIWTDFWLYYFAPFMGMLSAAQIFLNSRKKPMTICYKFCPNGEQKCIAKKCCGECNLVVRNWRVDNPIE